MHRYFVTGTDTDVGKTRVAAALALALRRAGESPTIVKIVQTGVVGEEEGDAARAGRLAGCPFVELARYAAPADPWSASIAQGSPPPSARDLARALDGVVGSIVAEGSGGIAVPLRAGESFGDVASLAHLRVVLAVGLRLGCLNHALLMLDHCERLGLRVAGAVLVERWEATGEAYHADVVRTLQDKTSVLGILPFAADEAASVEAGARLFAPLMHPTRTEER